MKQHSTMSGGASDGLSRPSLMQQSTISKSSRITAAQKPSARFLPLSSEVKQNQYIIHIVDVGVYPLSLDVNVIKEQIMAPVERHTVKFRGPGQALLQEIIRTRILEDSVSESIHKKHIIQKYIVKNKENAIMKSRTKLDSMRFNYTFGDEGIDRNEPLKAFMTRNIERRRFKRTPLAHELLSLTAMVDHIQKERKLKDSITRVKDVEWADPTEFLREVSPQFKTVDAIQSRFLQQRKLPEVERRPVGQGKPKWQIEQDRFLFEQAIRYPKMRQWLADQRARSLSPTVVAAPAKTPLKLAIAFGHSRNQSQEHIELKHSLNSLLMHSAPFIDEEPEERNILMIRRELKKTQEQGDGDTSRLSASSINNVQSYDSQLRVMLNRSKRRLDRVATVLERCRPALIKQTYFNAADEDSRYLSKAPAMQIEDELQI